MLLCLGIGQPLYYLVDRGSDNSSKCAEYKPDRWRNEREPDEVDVIVNGVQNTRQ